MDLARSEINTYHAFEWFARFPAMPVYYLNRFPAYKVGAQLELLVRRRRRVKSSVVLTEKYAYWINVSDDLYFLKDGKRFFVVERASGLPAFCIWSGLGKEQRNCTRATGSTGQLDISG